MATDRFFVWLVVCVLTDDVVGALATDTLLWFDGLIELVCSVAHIGG